MKPTLTATGFLRVYALPALLLFALPLSGLWFTGHAHVMSAIFRRPAMDFEVEAEVLDEAKAPELWAHVRTLCEKLRTPPPDHILAGIDANFFVTESEVRGAGRTLTGRTLYVSLSLLRLLKRSVADVVGTLGATQRVEYAVIGDTVNTASRLEGLNKELGTRLLLSPGTRDALAGVLPTRGLGEVPVKGKAQPVPVFTVDLEPSPA